MRGKGKSMIMSQMIQLVEHLLWYQEGTSTVCSLLQTGLHQGAHMTINKCSVNLFVKLTMIQKCPVCCPNAKRYHLNSKSVWKLSLWLSPFANWHSEERLPTWKGSLWLVPGTRPLCVDCKCLKLANDEGHAYGSAGPQWAAGSAWRGPCAGKPEEHGCQGPCHVVDLIPGTLLLSRLPPQPCSPSGKRERERREKKREEGL